jgi:hypothetical protein
MRSRLLLENRLFTEVDFIDAFIGRLKADIKAFVKLFKPQSLDDTFEYALQMETAFESQIKRLRIPSKPLQIIQTPKVPPPPQSSKNVLMDQRRLLGLCFKC